jgi:membrane-associated HD superfamily phosphohydrolase
MYAKVNLKGRFNFFNLALHKNKSKLVVPKAIYQYFIKNLLPEEYLKSNNNILDYCIAENSTSDWQQTKRTTENGINKDTPMQKINRYYISNEGYRIIKINKNDKRELSLESNKWKQKLFNKLEIKNKFVDYDVNKKYYLECIKKEINNVLSIPKNQLTLY